MNGIESSFKNTMEMKEHFKRRDLNIDQQYDEINLLIKKR